jgi:hypothetical protein
MIPIQRLVCSLVVIILISIISIPVADAQNILFLPPANLPASRQRSTRLIPGILS